MQQHKEVETNLACKYKIKDVPAVEYDEIIQWNTNDNWAHKQPKFCNKETKSGWHIQSYQHALNFTTWVY